MREVLNALAKLQEIDLGLRTHEENLSTYPKEIDRHQRELEQLEQSLAQLQEELKTSNTERGKCERGLEENGEAIKKLEARLFVIKTHREYEALEKEIAEAKKSGASIESEMLAHMESIESLQSKIESVSEELSVKEPELKAKIEELEGGLGESRSEYERGMVEKAKIAQRLSPAVLNVYERVRSKNCVAVVAVKGSVCQGCYMNIPPQLYNEVLTKMRLHQCPNCNRILFHYEEKEEQIATA